MTSKLFSELGLSAEVLRAIDQLGFEQASPIQAEAIPLLMAGRDIVGQSMTGSGKTAAFGIPAVEKTDPTQRVVQVLILCPTRELAIQVSEEIHKLAQFKTGIHPLPIYGGQSYERQFYGLKQGAQIVIGTPGRIMDHMRRGTLRLDTVKFAILDEADVMLNMGFREDIEHILQAVPATRQTVFFSATMSKPIRELIEKYSHEPQNVRIEQKALTVPTVEQFYYEVDRRSKMECLTRLIDLHDLKLGIIFCNTKRMVDDLVDYLEAAGYQADRLHGDMTQNMRDRVMNKFRQSGLEFLVATDVAARGIDVDDIQVVFNYDLPYDPEDYVHRIGRTGRAGRTGKAFSLVPPRELFQIRNIERYTNQRIQRGRFPTEDEVAEARETVFLDKLRALLTAGTFPKQDRLVDRLVEEGFVSNDIISALMHMLQSGEATKPAGAVENYDRPERPGDFAGRDERGGDRGGDRRGRPPGRFEERRPARYADRRDGPRDDRRDERPRRLEDRAPRPFGRPAGPEHRAPIKPVAPLKNSPWKAMKSAAPAPVPAESSAPAAPLPAPESAPVVAAVSAPAPAPIEVKMYSDEEILASVKAPEPRIVPKSPSRIKSAPPGMVVPKPKRRLVEGQTRLWVGLGEAQGLKPIDYVNAIAGETGLPGKVVGTVDIRERHAFVDVDAEHAHAIIAKLNRSQIGGHKVKAKVA